MDYKLAENETFTVTSGETSVDVFTLCPKQYVDELIGDLEEALEEI